MNITNYSIVLGSNSPRRRKILLEMGFDFTIISSNEEEKYPQNLIGYEVSEFLATQKSNILKVNIKFNDLLITADTIVLINNTILNKPKNKNEARQMLETLSGKTHKVITSVCLFVNGKREVFSETTFVTFCILSKVTIDFYINNYHPFDKAGSYGIQEWLGLVSIIKIDGSYTNVVGLPSSKLFEKIRTF